MKHKRNAGNTKAFNGSKTPKQPCIGNDLHRIMFMKGNFRRDLKDETVFKPNVLRQGEAGPLIETFGLQSVMKNSQKDLA